MKKSELRELIREVISEMSYDSKDEKRINDMISKAKDDDHLLKLATQMANSIKDSTKALRRAYAAEDQNYHDVAGVFYKRAKQLG